MSFSYIPIINPAEGLQASANRGPLFITLLSSIGTLSPLPYIGYLKSGQIRYMLGPLGNRVHAVLQQTVLG